MSSFCNEVFEAGNCDCGEEKKKSYLFLTEFTVLVAVLSLQMFQFKVGKIVFMLGLSNQMMLG